MLPLNNIKFHQFHGLFIFLQTIVVYQLILTITFIIICYLHYFLYLFLLTRNLNLFVTYFEFNFQVYQTFIPISLLLLFNLIHFYLNLYYLIDLNDSFYYLFLKFHKLGFLFHFSFSDFNFPF